MYWGFFVFFLVEKKGILECMMFKKVCLENFGKMGNCIYFLILCFFLEEKCFFFSEWNFFFLECLEINMIIVIWNKDR